MSSRRAAAPALTLAALLSTAGIMTAAVLGAPAAAAAPAALANAVTAVTAAPLTGWPVGAQCTTANRATYRVSISGPSRKVRVQQQQASGKWSTRATVRSRAKSTTRISLKSDTAPRAWRLSVAGAAGHQPQVTATLNLQRGCPAQLSAERQAPATTQATAAAPQSTPAQQAPSTPAGQSAAAAGGPVTQLDPITTPTNPSDPAVTTAVPDPRPGPTNTGTLNTNQTTLTGTNKPYTADVISGTKYIINTPNAVYNNWTFNYIVEVRAPGVKFTNCLFAGINGNPADTALLMVRPEPFPAGQPSATAEDSTFNPTYPNNYIDGVRGSNYTLRRVEITRTVDGASIYGTTTRTDPNAGNVTIENSWIHDLPHYNDTSHTDGSHNDAVQIAGGHNIRFTGNRVDGEIYNAVIMATQGRNDIYNLTISNNWLAGGACSINIYDKQSTAITGLAMTNNIFTRGSTRITDCAMIVTLATRAIATATANTWHNNTTPTPTMKNGG